MNLWENRDFTVMLLKEVNHLIKSNDYLYEIKFDGIRACIFVNKDSIKIISRNKKDITNLFPELSQIKKAFKNNTVLDGEIICLVNSKISFEAVSLRMHLKSRDKIKMVSNENPAIFVAFDILYLEKDLINLPLIERKKVLNKFKENEAFLISKVYDNSTKLFKFIKDNDMEGIIAKLKNSKYLINTRSNNWLKIKNYKVDNFFIGGYEVKKNNYLSLKLGEYQNGNLLYVGSVSLTKNNKLYDKIIKLKNVKNAFSNYYEINVNYIKPILKCKVKYIEKTKNNQLRQPIIVKE